MTSNVYLYYSYLLRVLGICPGVGCPVYRTPAPSLQLLSVFHQTGPGLARLGVTAEARTAERERERERDLRPGSEAAELQLTQTAPSQN